MQFLSRLFATRRELVRLADSVKFWRSRAVRLEKENKDLIARMAARDAEWADRFLTAIGKTYAIADSAEARAFYSEKDLDAGKEEMKREYLQAKFDALKEDAVEAGLPVSAADKLYREREPQFIEDFNLEFGFRN